MTTEILLGVVLFTAIVFLLVAVILAARAKLVNSGDVTIDINDAADRKLTVAAGGKLLQTLSANGVFLSSACGGGGTCAQCKCMVTSGGGSALPTEVPHFTKGELREGWRLSCQVAVKENMTIQVDPEVFGVKNRPAPTFP